MPAHIGSFDKMKLLVGFLRVNLDPRKKFESLRRMRILTKTRRNDYDGTPDAPNNRAAYVPWKKIVQVPEQNRLSRESVKLTYGSFREALDRLDHRLDPARPHVGHSYIDQREWDLYLQPGTAFDELVQQFFAERRGQVLFIFHRGHNPKLKRIEALPTGGEPVIIWSDAT